MNLKDRLIRLTLAFVITGIVAAQIPTRSSVSLAADDGCPGRDSFDEVSLNFDHLLDLDPQTFPEFGALGIGIYGGGVALNLFPSAPWCPNNKKENLNVIMADNSDGFGAVTKIIENADEAEKYSTGAYTLFLPINDTLGAERATKLQDPTNKDEAKQFLASITVAGSYNFERLKELAINGKSLITLSGDTLTLEIEGETLTANGVEILANEIPYANGWVLTTSGVVVAK